MEESIHSDLMRFLYHEMPSTEAARFSETLDDDHELRSEFDQLLKAKMALPSVQFNPSDETLQKIFRYSATTAFEIHP